MGLSKSQFRQFRKKLKLLLVVVVLRFIPVFQPLRFQRPLQWRRSLPKLKPKPEIPVAVHPDPRIQVALQAMMNMGFTNDGGWLANLLEAKDGDIGKVLDILQPVKK